MIPIASAALGRSIRLRIVARGALYDLDYAIGAGAWRTARNDVDGSILSTALAGGFTGTMIGPYARAAPRQAPMVSGVD